MRLMKKMYVSNIVGASVNKMTIASVAIVLNQFPSFSTAAVGQCCQIYKIFTGKAVEVIFLLSTEA